ncbi:MAG: hypothetical protein KDA79_19800 [Planctomycetaceae bacterium]|nr:hypothetical protein [Planctomycetaceae bacterium]
MNSTVLAEQGIAASRSIETCTDAEVDAIHEMRLRTWARQNFVPAAERSSEWHPVVLDEMQRKDSGQ